MPYLTITNPAKALGCARSVRACLRAADLRSKVVAFVGPILASRKPYYEMTALELDAAVRAIVESSSSENEVLRRIESELGYNPEGVSITSHLSTNTVGNEARDLVRALGGLVMKNGALVRIQVWDGAGEPVSL
jgi:hypothetical protein